MSKVIVITGAGSGLGRELARRLSSDGETVVLLGRTLPKLESVASELGDRAMAVRCDVASPASVEEAFAEIVDRHGGLDVLINNAAVFVPAAIREASNELIVGTINTNLTGAILCAKAASALLRPNGHIINVTSESVVLPFPLLTLYQASKAGLEKFSESLHRELGPSGVRVTTVRAGSMYGEDYAWDIDAAASERFFEACAKAGINLLERPLSHFSSVTQVFRNILDLPQDLHVAQVNCHARADAQ